MAADAGREQRVRPAPRRHPVLLAVDREGQLPGGDVDEFDRAGASASFEANTPHTYGNAGDEPVRMYMTVSVPPVQ